MPRLRPPAPLPFLSPVTDRAPALCNTTYRTRVMGTTPWQVVPLNLEPIASGDHTR